jgi:hypothetical protein
MLYAPWKPIIPRRSTMQNLKTVNIFQRTFGDIELRYGCTGGAGAAPADKFIQRGLGAFGYDPDAAVRVVFNGAGQPEPYAYRAGRGPVINALKLTS